MGIGLSVLLLGLCLAGCSQDRPTDPARVELEPEVLSLVEDSLSTRPAAYDTLAPRPGAGAGTGLDTLTLVHITADGRRSAAYPVSAEDPLEIGIVIADDSPEDGEGGGALFAAHLSLLLKDGRQWGTPAAADAPLLPRIEGGFLRHGYITADGAETIYVFWDLGGPEYLASGGPSLSEIDSIGVALVLANDYRIYLRVNGESLATVGAPGNVRDGSNLAVVAIRLALE